LAYRFALPLAGAVSIHHASQGSPKADRLTAVQDGRVPRPCVRASNALPDRELAALDVCSSAGPWLFMDDVLPGDGCVSSGCEFRLDTRRLHQHENFVSRTCFGTSHLQGLTMAVTLHFLGKVGGESIPSVCAAGRCCFERAALASSRTFDPTSWS
jgi:hypothetical protein